MGTLERYLFRATATAFLAALMVLTGVVWITQALREFDLVTAKGQTFWTFLIATGLALPSLVLVVAPLALFGAIAWALNRLNADSELAALSASGVTPARLLRPFAALSLVVALMVGMLSVSAIPTSLRMLRDLVTRIRADVVVNVLREGAFTTLDEGITLHVRRRTAGGALEGIFVEDDRDPAQNMVYTAERGRVVESGDGTFLVLERGAVQRKENKAQDAAIVVFDRYAFDLSPLANATQAISYKPRERTMAELLTPDWSDPVVQAALGRFRAELHERLVNPLYPIAFAVIAFAALGRPRTTRQDRTVWIATAVALVLAVRIAGLGATNLAARSEWAAPLIYAAPLLAIGLGLGWIFGGPGLPGRLARRAAPGTAA